MTRKAHPDQKQTSNQVTMPVLDHQYEVYGQLLKRDMAGGTIFAVAISASVGVLAVIGIAIMACRMKRH